MSFTHVALVGVWIFASIQAVVLMSVLRFLTRYKNHPDVVGDVQGPRPGRPPPTDLVNSAGHTSSLASGDTGINHVFFLSVTCSPCKHLLDHLEEAAAEEFLGTCRFVIKGPAQSINSLVDDKGLDPALVVPDADGAISSAWRVKVRPFLAVLDDRGYVIDTGRPGSRETLYKLTNDLGTAEPFALS